MDNIKSESTFNKLNHVFKIISFGKLKDDIDDSLLEKLISFIRRENEKSENFVPEMLKKTDLEKYLMEGLNGAFTSTSQQTLCFLLKLLSACNNHRHILLALEKDENKLLSLISNIFQKNNYSLSNFSIKASILEFLSVLASEEKYILWLHRNGAVDFGTRCLAEDSLYVQRTAAVLIATQLSTWLRASKDDAINGNTCLSIFQDTTQQLFLYLGNPSVSSKLHPSGKLVGSAVQVFRIFSELKPENGESVPVKKVLDIINWHLTTTKPDPNYLDKLLELLSIFVSPWRDRPAMDGLITKLIHVKLFPSVLHFLSLSIVRHHSNCSLSKEILDIFLAALSYLTDAGNISVNIVSCLQSAMNDKSSTIKTINLNISSIFKISKILTRQQKQEICNQLQKILVITIQHTVKSTLQSYCFNCQKLQIAILTYVLNNFEIYDCEHVKPDDIFSLATIIIKLIENPNTVSIVIDKCTKILGNLLCFWGKLCTRQNIAWSNFLPLDNFGNALIKRLLDPNWEVIDSILCLIDDIFFTHSDIIPWLCRNAIHGIVWNIATSEIYEGYIRASAIRTVSNFVLSSEGWEHLQREKELSLDDALMMYCRALLCNSDTFVNRAAARAIFSWIESRDVPQYFYKSLYMAVTADLDWEVKMSALQSWELILKQHLLPSICNAEELLMNVCRCGLARSLISASEDPDKSVKNLAVRILLDLSDRVNIDLSSTTFDINSSVDICTEDKLETLSSKTPISNENRMRIIETVLDIDTNKQIFHLIKPISECNNILDIFHNNEKVNVRDFLKILHSENLIVILEESKKSTDLYTNNFESLLDDIINSEDTKFQGMDCY